MKLKTLLNLIKDAFYQITGWDMPREGKLVLTKNAVHKMTEYQIDEKTLKDAFRFGIEINRGDKIQITRKYAEYEIGLWYKVIYTPYHHSIQSEKKYLVITCWKRY